MAFGGRVKSGLNKVVGNVGSALKRVGQHTLPVLKSVGSFALKHHQPIAMLATGLADAMPNSKVAQAIGAGAFIGSAALTAKGIGENWLGGTAKI
jgi:hypothetical protein